jgi:hypothetical protein
MYGTLTLEVDVCVIYFPFRLGTDGPARIYRRQAPTWAASELDCVAPKNLRGSEEVAEVVLLGPEHPDPICEAADPIGLVESGNGLCG